jgi:uncharacterized surface protein with fasciclin (FAS1) repeats
VKEERRNKTSINYRFSDLSATIADLQLQLRALQQAVGINRAQIASNIADTSANSNEIVKNLAGITTSKDQFKQFVAAIKALMTGTVGAVRNIPLLSALVAPVDIFVAALDKFL